MEEEASDTYQIEEEAQRGEIKERGTRKWQK